MQITISDEKARDLLADLPASTTTTVTELKDKLKEGLTRNVMLSADELDMVLVVLDAMTPAKLEADYKAVNESMGRQAPIDATVMLARFRSAQSKLRTIHVRQLAREQGRG